MITTNVEGYACTGDQMVRVSFSFPHGTLVVPGRGLHTDELWLLVEPEDIENWSYWIVLRKEDTYDPLVFREIVPWNGLWWGLGEFPHYEYIVPTGEA